MTIAWLLGLGAFLLLTLVGELVRQARRTASAAESVAERLDYLEGLITGLAADVDALRQLKVQESEFPTIDPDASGGDQEH